MPYSAFVDGKRKMNVLRLRTSVSSYQLHCSFIVIIHTVHMLQLFIVQYYMTRTIFLLMLSAVELEAL